MFPLVFELHSHPATTPASSWPRSVRTISLLIASRRTWTLLLIIGIPIVGNVDWRHQITQSLNNAVPRGDTHSPLSILNRSISTWFVVDQRAGRFAQLQWQTADKLGKIRRRRQR